MSFTAAAAVALGLTAGFYLLRAAMVGLMTGTMGAASLTVASILGGLALVLGGLVGIYMYATGAGEGFKGILLGVVSAILVAIGAVLLGFTMVGPVALAAIVFFVFSLFRYGDEVKAFLVGAKNFFFGLGGMIWYGLLGALASVAGIIAGFFATWTTLIFGIVNGIIKAIFAVGKSFYDDVIKGGGSLIDWFKSIPKTLTKGFTDGFKQVFSEVITIYNAFAKKMKFDIPDWVPVVGGKEFKLPQIPQFAKGGIVNSPTLAMIGEDGPEAVVPLSRRNNPDGIGLGGGGGITVNINVGGVTDRTDKKQLAREIGDLVRAEMARGGRSYGNRRSAV